MRVWVYTGCATGAGCQHALYRQQTLHAAINRCSDASSGIHFSKMHCILHCTCPRHRKTMFLSHDNKAPLAARRLPGDFLCWGTRCFAKQTKSIALQHRLVLCFCFMLMHVHRSGPTARATSLIRSSRHHSRDVMRVSPANRRRRRCLNNCAPLCTITCLLCFRNHVFNSMPEA